MKPILATFALACALMLGLVVAPIALASDPRGEPVKPMRPPPKVPGEHPGAPEEPGKPKVAAKPKTALETAEGEAENTKKFKKLTKATLTREQANDFLAQKRAAATGKKAAERELKDAKTELVKDYVAAEQLKKARNASQKNVDSLKKALDTAKATPLTQTQAATDLINGLDLRYNAAKIIHDKGPGAEYEAANTKLVATVKRFRDAEKGLTDAHEEIGDVEQRRLVTQRANYLAAKAAKQGIYGPLPQIDAFARQNIYGSAPQVAPNGVEPAGAALDVAQPMPQVYGQIRPGGAVYDKAPPTSEYGPAPPLE
jgi:hypothetical protein